VHSKPVEACVGGLAMVRLDAQFDDLVRPFYVQVLHGEVLEGSAIVLELVLAEEHRFLVLLLLQPLNICKSD